MIESDLQQLVRAEAPKHGVRLWRNNNGAFKCPKTGRLIRYGLCNDSKKQSKKIKSSDLIGITPYTITPDDVGKTIGVFTSYEIKKPGWVYQGTEAEEAQLKWINLILAFGGIAKFVTTIEDIWQK